MEIFWTDDFADGFCRLGEEESAHCVRVLRHRAGDHVNVIDGAGTMYDCVLVSDTPKVAMAKVLAAHEGWGGHDYDLTMAVCPTKNIERYEWFAEKSAEIGVDMIVPVIGERSERRKLKTDRLHRILLSAAKQSLKSRIPELGEPETVMEYIARTAGSESLKLIAYCSGEMLRRSMKEVLSEYRGREIIILIGPEGDFSKAEAEAAVAAGYIPVSLGNSRLRTETAAIVSVSMVYYACMT